MNRAYAVLEIKAASDGGKRTFRGVATTPTPDRMQDIVVPTGLKFKLPIPLLWQHDGGDPIGWVNSAKVTSKGIEVEGEIAAIPDEGDLQKRLDKAWQYIKNKLVRGLSIGFNPIKYEYIEATGGLQFNESEWLELSAVTIPANQEATITTIKSLDVKALAALGREGPPSRPSPGASGQKQQAASGRLFHSRSQKGNTMNLKEMIEARSTKNARLKELIDLRTAESRGFSEDEGAEFDALTDEVKSLDDDIRVAKYHQSNAAAATPVSKEFGRGPTILVKKEDPEDKFKGQSGIRLFIAKALSYIEMREGNFEGASVSRLAEQRWGKSHPKLVQYIKAAVAGGGTGSGEWGAELAQSDARYRGDFVNYLYGRTVFERLGLRPVPANVHIKGQDGAATGYWTGESKAIKVSKSDFSDVELRNLKAGGISVCSKELVQDTSQEAEMWILDSLRQAIEQRVDGTFLSSTAASSGVSPAGLLNGVTALTASGIDADALRSDLQRLYHPFILAKNSTDLMLVMNPALAKAVSLMTNALGQTEFTGLTQNGGTLLGDPVLTGDNVGAGDMILLKPSDIWKIGDSGVQMSMSDSAMVEQDDSPTGATDTPTAASATMVSLWQSDSVGFKITRRINYAKRRTGVVQFIGNANYGIGAGLTTS